MQVRELLERTSDVYDIAHRLRIDPLTVQAVIDFINGLLT